MFGTRPRANTFAHSITPIVAQRLAMTDPSGSHPDDREAELQELAARARDHPRVVDAFLAKSFTDRLLAVDLESGTGEVPQTLVTLLEDHGCYGANEVYGRECDDSSGAGTFGGRERHQFVDTETRGEHRSYVVD